MQTRKDFEPPARLEKVGVVLTGIRKTVDHILRGRFSEAGYTAYLTEMAFRSVTTRGLRERSGKVKAAETVKKI